MSSSFLALSLAAATAPPGGGLAAQFSFFFPLILVVLIFWILVWRPQNRRARQHQAEIMAIKKGDEIVTAGGIRGRVTKASDEEVEVEIAQGVKVKVVKATISQMVKPKPKPAND